jgi:hypothetical protein
MPKPQDFKHHARVVPAYHMGVFFPLVINFFWAVYRLTQAGLTGEAIVGVLLAFALLLMFGSVRRQILTVQDRVIRLEMRLRLGQVLPADLRMQISTLTIPQLVALRFASDAELPDLTREVLAGTVPTQKDIKMRVKNWQADYQRA